MLISEFNFELPAELVAQAPLTRREDSRMLIVDSAANNWRDAHFKSFPEYVGPGDVVVLNNTRVFPARLVGRRAGFDGKVELFLVREISQNVWESLARPARRFRSGTKLIFGNAALQATVLEKQADGRVIIEFKADADFAKKLDEIGQTPLPPYIRREKNLDDNAADLIADSAKNPEENLFDERRRQDRERYQTVYAKERGAIAAPTAGLHFTSEVLQAVKDRGAQIVEITLHVGYGTFEPVRVADLSDHRVAPETGEISHEAAEIINAAKAAGKRIVAVGTTTTRALENAASENGVVQAGKQTAQITVTPGYKFKMVNALLTNFHLPESSLLVLVSTFAGHKLTMAAYQHAVREKYRFYSYGDCMLIV